MACLSKVAVHIHHEHLHCRIPQDFVDVDGSFQFFSGGQSFQCIDQPHFVCISGIELGMTEDIVIAVEIIVCIAQMDIGVFVAKFFIIRLVKLPIA